MVYTMNINTLLRYDQYGATLKDLNVRFVNARIAPANKENEENHSNDDFPNNGFVDTQKDSTHFSEESIKLAKQFAAQDAQNLFSSTVTLPTPETPGEARTKNSNVQTEKKAVHTKSNNSTDNPSEENSFETDTTDDLTYEKSITDNQKSPLAESSLYNVAVDVAISESISQLPYHVQNTLSSTVEKNTHATLSNPYIQRIVQKVDLVA